MALGDIRGASGSGLTQISDLGTLELRHEKPTLVFMESDATLPAGLWRFEAQGNQLKLKQNTATAGDFSTSNDSLVIGSEGELLSSVTVFADNPVTAGIAGGAATGTAGDENVMLLPGMAFEYHILGTQTILAPSMTANGLDINMDQTGDDGIEIGRGILASSGSARVVGTDAAFYFEVKFRITDVSGTDDCAIGFRKAEDYNANIDDNDEMAALNVISGAINIETILNGAGTTTTDTTDTWADLATHTLRVNVSAAGVVTYLIDGVAPTTTAAFTFDDTEVVVPFFFFLNAADIAGPVDLIHWKEGFQA